MNKKVIVRFVWDLLMILFFLGFVFALLWYTNGSLEMYCVKGGFTTEYIT